MRSRALCGAMSSERRFSAGFGIAALHIIPREEPRRLGGRTVAAAGGHRDQTRGESGSPLQRLAEIGAPKGGASSMTEGYTVVSFQGPCHAAPISTVPT